MICNHINNIYKKISNSKIKMNNKKTPSSATTASSSQENLKLDGTNTFNNDHVKAINYLNSLKPNELIDDKLAYEAMFLLACDLVDELLNTKIVQNLAESTGKLFAHVLLELYNVSSEIDFSNFKIDLKNKTGKDISKNDQRVSLIAFILEIISLVASKSVPFCTIFCVNNGLNSHLAFLADSNIRSRIMNVKLNDFLNGELEFVYWLVINLNVLSNCYEQSVQTWLDAKACETLFEIAKLKPNCKVEAFVTICKIVNDEKIESMRDRMCQVTRYVSKMGEECANKLLSDQVDREEVDEFAGDDYDEGSSSDGGVYRGARLVYIENENGLWVNAMVILKALYKLAVNDSLRENIYFVNEMRKHVMAFILKGNELEQRLALALLGQLSFNKLVAEDIAKCEELVGYLNDAGNSSGLEQMKWIILWNLKSVKEKEVEEVIASDGDNRMKLTNDDDQGHDVMISYNRVSIDLCMKIKSELTNNGHKVHINKKSLGI